MTQIQLIPSFLCRACSALVAAALLWAPSLAEACAACSTGRDDETRAAFIATTVFLSVLPLLMIGGIVLWLRRRARALHNGGELRSAPERGELPPLPGPQLPLES